MDSKELLERVKADGVRFMSYQFTDINGVVKSVESPIEKLPGALQNGVWFDGSSVEGFARIQESDMHLIIDTDSYAVLPWTPTELKRARVFCDIYLPNMKPFPGDPRGVLKRNLEKAKAKGWTFHVGPEPEFFLFNPTNGSGVHPVTYDVGSYFDFSPNDGAVRVRTELIDALMSMGLEVEVGHHEVARGQHEIDFRFTDALRAADNVLTLKYTVKAIAAQHGITASFMPKPIFGSSGSGMHCHQSFSDESGTNIFFNPKDEYHLSDIAYGFIGGQLKHARGMSAVLAPSVNSYKRLVPGFEAPVYICWAQTNRSALIRIPRHTKGLDNATRAELRCPDPSCNPYLAMAVMVATGLDGIEKKMRVPSPMNDVNIYDLTPEDRMKMKIEELPGSLHEALDELKKDKVVQDALGDVAYETFLRARQEEWDEFNMHVTDWEIGRYLEKC